MMMGMLTTKRPTAPATRFGFGRDLLEDFEDLASRVFGDRGDGLFAGGSLPALDLAENEGAVEAKLDLPGVDPKQIDVRVNANVLTVSAKREEEKEESGKTFHRVERRAGVFSRSVMLPCSVDENKVDARYHDGVLTVTLPKAEHAKAHKIAVKS